MELLWLVVEGGKSKDTGKKVKRTCETDTTSRSGKWVMRHKVILMWCILSLVVSLCVEE